MPSWWGKSASKEPKKKTNKESLFDTFHWKCKLPSDGKVSNKSDRRTSDTISGKGSKSRTVSRTSSPSKVVRSQSFIDRPQPLPHPGLQQSGVRRTDSGMSVSSKSRLDKGCKSPFLPLPRPSCMRRRREPADMDRDDLSSGSSIDSDDPADSHQQSPLATDCGSGSRTAVGSPNHSMMARDQPGMEIKSMEATRQANQVTPASLKRRNLSSHVSNLQVPSHGTFYNAPDSSLSSPSRSPVRAFGTEQTTNSAFWAGKAYPEVSVLGSGHCSSPGSGQNSGHNSMGGDMPGQIFWQPSRGSPEYSPIPSPRMTSPGPSSRIQSGSVTPLHPRAGGSVTDDGKQSHRLPLPPVGTISNNISPFCHSNSAATSPSVPRSPGRAENPPITSPCSRWKKGKLLGRGTYGHVYIGFNSEKGEMCAMKEVTMFSDDGKSKECAKQLGQVRCPCFYEFPLGNITVVAYHEEIALLSRLRHPNIVQYYGSETVDDKLYIYLEYVSGGSIYKLLQEYGQFGESAIRSYTKQILSGLAYLHAKKTIHRDIKGANILVDPNGRVKLADFGMAKHITGQSCPLSFKGSPYWMAPEVIRNSSSCTLAVDIWSLGCTVLEMATAKPPWSEYEGVAAMFKIGNSKDLPPIPDNLSDEGKDFVRRCLQRNPICRPSAAQLLDHAFIKKAAPTLEKPVMFPEPPTELQPEVVPRGKGFVRNASNMESNKFTLHSSRVSKGNLYSSGTNMPRNISCPVSPIRSPLLRPRSPQNLNGRLSPSPISSPHTMSGSSTPLTSGDGTIPFPPLNQSVYLQEGFGSQPKRSQCATCGYNSPYTSPNRDIFRGIHPGPQIMLSPNENEAYGNQFGRPINRKMYDGQPVLADRVSQQLMKDRAKTSPSLDLSSCPPSPRHMN